MFPNRKISQAELQARHAAIITSSDDAIVSKSLDGIVESWNGAAERIFGYTAAEMIGKPIALLVPPERENEEPEILQRLRRGERVDHFETVRIRKDGVRINVSVTISPIRDETGRIIGASKIARDITTLKKVMAEREHLLKSEQAARQEAERVNRTKDEFLATLSHELRTPLNAILGWATLLRSQQVDPQTMARALETIERNARAQHQLVEDLLDMSRVVAGQFRLDVQRVDLPSVVMNAIESVQPAADAKGVRLAQVLDPTAGPVMGDPGRLQQVMWNLLTNAVKFTPRGGSVQVWLRRVNSHIEVSVSDTGIGISAEFMPQLFARFTQADSSTTRRHGGLGLGLAIVRHLVELHGGTVEAASPGEGAGTTITVNLPLTAVASPVADRTDAHPAYPTVPAAPVPGPPVDLAGVRVMVVDDEPDACALIDQVLRSKGATVWTLHSARAAVDLLHTERPDVLLSDIGMPDEDGYQLLERVRRLSAESASVPAVALTAFARPEDRRRALMAGFQMHLPKPVEPAELLVVVASLAGRIAAAEDRGSAP